MVQTISVLLFEHFSNHCLANAVEPFRAANTIARRDLYAWQFLSVAGGRVQSSSGLPVDTLKWSAVMPAGACLLVMPSYGFQDFATPQMARMLRGAQARFDRVVGLDTGAWLLAAAGLLANRRATIHWDELTRFAEAFPDTTVTEDRFVIDGAVATCGGAATAIDLSLQLIEAQHSAFFAREVAALFMHGNLLDLPDPLQRATPDRLVQSAMALMRRNIEQPMTIPALAAVLHTEQRALEEAFQRALNTTPRSAYRAVRLREARRLVLLSRLKMAEIATRCGYHDASALTRAYKSAFGHTPRAHRRSG